jgi:hypothetical protein
MTTPRLRSETVHNSADRADRIDPPPQGEHHDRDDRERDRVDLQPGQARREVAEVLHEADDAGRHDQRDREERGPDEQERHEPPAPVLERLAEVEVGPAGAGHRGAELGPDQPVGEREQRAEDPAEDRLRSPAWRSSAGIVTNGPIPHICVMFSATAERSPSRRSNPSSPCAPRAAAGSVPGSRANRASRISVIWSSCLAARAGRTEACVHAARRRHTRRGQTATSPGGPRAPGGNLGT